MRFRSVPYFLTKFMVLGMVFVWFLSFFLLFFVTLFWLGFGN